MNICWPLLFLSDSWHSFFFCSRAVLSIAILSALTLNCANTSVAQTPAHPGTLVLEPNHISSADLSAGAAIVYAVSPHVGDCMYVTIEPDRVTTATAEVISPDGVPLQKFSSIDFYGSQIPLATMATSDGPYSVHVRNTGSAAGAYKLDLLSSQPTPGTQCQRLDALNAFSRGLESARNRSYAEATAAMENAIKAANDSHDRPLQGFVLSGLGDLYRAQGKLDDAEASYEAALTIKRELKDRWGEGLVLNNLGATYGSKRELDKAIETLKQALIIRRETNDLLGQQTTLSNLGLAYETFNKFDTAMQWYGDLLKVDQELKDRESETEDLESMGLCARRLSHMDEALDYQEKSLTMARDIKDRRLEAAALMELGTINNITGKPANAVQFYQLAMKIQQELQNRSGVAKLQNNLGLVYTSLGEYEKAIAEHQQAFEAFRTLKDRLNEAAALVNAGLAYRHMSEYEKAIEKYELALPLLRDLNNRRGEATTLNNLGSCYLALGEDEKGVGYYNQALAIHREVKDRLGEAQTLDNLGLANHSTGHYGKALEYEQQAATAFRDAKNREGEAATLANIAEEYHSLKQDNLALEYANQGLTIGRQIASREDEALSLSILGTCYRELNQSGKAIQSFRESLAIEAELKERAEQAETLKELMDTAQQMGNPQLAIVYGKLSVNTIQGMRSAINGLGVQEQRSFARKNAEAYHNLADLLVAQGRLFEAQQVLDLLKEEEYFNFIRRAGALSGSGDLKLNNRDAEPLVELDRERQALLAKASLSPEEIARKEILEAQLSAAKVAAGEFFAEFGKLETPGSVAGAEQVARNEEKEAHALQKILTRSPGTVALYTLVGGSSYHTLLITPTLMKAREQNISPAKLREKIFAWREALRSPNSDPMPLAKELYDIIIGDLDRDLEAAHATTLVWSLDDALRYVPMAALNNGHYYLAERYTSVIRTKASDLGGARSVRVTALAAGVSEAREGLPPLKGVDEELHSIFFKDGAPHVSGVVPASPDILMNGQFSADALRAGLHHDPPLPVVHIASHFVVGANDATSYLLLGTGKLSLAELRSSEDYDFNGVDLLTLSACNTAMASNNGDGHEIDGFGFLAEEKGARTVMAALWEVYDPSTSEFMQQFYADLSRNANMNKARALQGAELALLHGNVSGTGAQHRVAEEGDIPRSTQTSYAHPYYWAPFVLMGDWN